MPLAVDQSFGLTWRIEDYSLWPGGDESEVPWPWTPIFTLEALGNTSWQFDLCPRTAEDAIALSFTRIKSHSDLEDNVTVHYTISILGKDCSAFRQVTGTVNDTPGHMRLVDLIRREDLPPEQLPDDRFSFVCEIRQQKPDEPKDDLHGCKWKGELQSLSDAMRELFRTGHLSDLKLVSDDGRRIAVHKSVVFARWEKLRDIVEGGPATNRIAVRGVSGSTLAAFVSYLYSGTLPGRDVTRELYDFACENAPQMPDLFRTGPSDVSMRTRQWMERLTFTWRVKGVDSLPLYRVLRFQELVCGEIAVELDVKNDEGFGEPCLAVTLSVSEVADDFCVVRCTATFVVDEVPVETLCSSHRFQRDFEEWNLPSFLPMRLLASIPGETLTRRSVEFEITVSDEPLHSVTERCVTEFRTGSRGIHQVEQLASEFREFFMLQPCMQDVSLRSEGGSFLTCRALLCARSRAFRRFFRNRRKGRITLAITRIDSVVLAGVLEYMYTGWTKLSFPEVFQMAHLALCFSLFGLLRKCEQFYTMPPQNMMDYVNPNLPL